jgi:predicted DCC family thiol-disulfide oxidoreductase YuxK
MNDEGAWSLILYDGVCGLCDHFVSFVLRRDHRHRFRFAALQSDPAQKLLAAKGKVIEVERLETLVVVTPAGEVLERSAAVFWVLRGLGGGWGVLSWLRVLPQGLIDWGYDQIARRRLRIWGQLPACRIPSPAERSRFLDASLDA